MFMLYVGAGVVVFIVFVIVFRPNRKVRRYREQKWHD